MAESNERCARPTTDDPLVLVVDDEVELCRRVARLLERGGYRTLVAFTAGEALAQLEDHPVDVVVSDIMLPDMNGLDLLEHLRHRPCPIAVVMMTGVDDTATASRAQELGAYGYLTKPFDRNALLISVSGARQRLALEAENANYRSYLEGALEERTEELESSKRIAAALINRTSDALLVIDVDLRLTYGSKVVQHMFGYDDQAILGEEITQFIHPDDQAGVIDAQARAAETDSPQTVEVRLLRSDTTWTWCEAVGEAHLDDPAINGWIVSLRNIDDRKRREKRLQQQALHDQLTGLPNRYALADRLRSVLATVGDTTTRTAVLFLDLDRLKVINDSLGHEVGDALLKVVGERLQSVVRTTDMVCRFGGDEFVVVCEHLPSDEHAITTAHRIGMKMGEPIELADRTFHVSASIGIAMASTGYDDPETLIRDADAAMYRAKTSGRGEVRVFDPATHHQAVQRLEFETAIRSGEAQTQWVCHYQPQCDITTDEMVGLEALVRWQHPEHGLLHPADFLPILEDAGLTSELDRHVLFEACRFAARPELDGMRMSVNVSAGQVLASDYPAAVVRALEESGLPAERLCVEITESAMIKDLPTARQTLAALRDLGVSIAVDDFGTGFSALSYLAELPVDELKIDRSFVVQSDAEIGRKLLEGIVSLANTMGMISLAEGVETDEQLELLRDAGCRNYQGYRVAKPLPADELLRLVSHRSMVLAARPT